MKFFRSWLVACLLYVPHTLLADTETPFNRGINLTNWLQAGSPSEIQFNRYTQRDFERIRNLGADVIRLPLNLHFMTSGAPDYSLDPVFLGYLDETIEWAEALGLHLILDNHTFDPAINTDPAVGQILEKVWLQMAERYKDRSELIYYEILNEPHGIDDATWNAIQQDIVEVIRSVDDFHTIVVGGAGWNSYANLDAMPVYEDDNLIYTFHFYDPFIFTHQGAGWGSPNLGELAGVPFPYRAEDMPDLPASLANTWVAGAYDAYPEEGTVARVQELLDIAIRFRDERQVPIFLGEMGVLMFQSPPEDRVYWHQVVREYLDANDVSWTLWDYHGGFGVFENGSNGVYEHDLNVALLEALGFTVPPQTDYVVPPATVGFDVYFDATAEGGYLYGSNAGSINPMSADKPWEGNRVLHWSGAPAYGAFGFDFQPNSDLQFLVDNGYALELMVRGDTPGTGFEVRFMDTDTGTEDHSWRIGVGVDDNLVTWDGEWQRLRVPLAGLEETGAWDSGEWYNPEGLFDWSAVDRLEIATGEAGLGNANLWFDAIQVTAASPAEPRLSNDAGASGLFFDPATSGHGFDFNVVDGGLVVYYYGHTATGERLWLISGLYTENLEFGRPIELEFYVIVEGTFGSPVLPTTLWGTIRITLDSCTSGSAEFDGIDGQLSMPLLRLAGVPGLGCS